MVLGLWLWRAAWAGEPDEGDDLDIAPDAHEKAQNQDFQVQQKAVDLDEDDVQMVDFVAEQRKKPPAPAWWHVDPTGKVPLSDAFDVQIVAYNDRYVVADLPVLVADGREAFRAAHPAGIVVVGDITIGGQHQVVTQQVTPDAVLESGPTLVFLHAALPDPDPTGDVRFVVKAGELPASPPAAAPSPNGSHPATSEPPAPPKELYARTTVFVRK